MQGMIFPDGNWKCWLTERHFIMGIQRSFNLLNKCQKCVYLQIETTVLLRGVSATLSIQAREFRTYVTKICQKNLQEQKNLLLYFTTSKWLIGKNNQLIGIGQLIKITKYTNCNLSSFLFFFFLSSHLNFNQIVIQ